MDFLSFNIILLICFTISEGFFLHQIKYLLREIDRTAAHLDSSAITTEWIEQPLDHFNTSENRTWKMKYFQRLDIWKPSGPLFFFINGEWPAGTGFLKAGLTYDLANETNGALFSSEHRYYGASKPFEDLTTENLQYLSSRQALADVARLIEKVKESSKFNSSKVVVVGASYSANLAAWMKVLYPNLVDAAIASSGPVLAKEDFFEYLETVSDDFEQYGTPDCYDNIVELFNKYKISFETEEGIKKLKEELKICDDVDFSKWENKELFFLSRASSFMGTAQYGSTDSIKRHCKGLFNDSRILAHLDDEENLWNIKKSCYDYTFDSFIDDLKSDDVYNCWTYQTCTEFGYYQTTTSKKQPFTDNISLEFFYKMCSAAFGSEFDGRRVEQGVSNTNAMYGGLSPNVTNVVFVNGELDPWHRLGILEDVSYDAPAKMIPRSSHCRDLLPDDSSDHEELKEARRYIKYLIKKWTGVGIFANEKV